MNPVFRFVLAALLFGVAGCGPVRTTDREQAPAASKAAAPAQDSPRVARDEPPKAKPSAAPKPAPAPKPRVAPAKTPAASPAPASATTAAPSSAPPKPPLDLKALEQRLKDTDAIGVLTKLSLKNQVDDLIAKFRAYHGGTTPPTLPQLRPQFELLVMKVLALLQDKDPRLAGDISASREAIWAVLADKGKLGQYS